MQFYHKCEKTVTGTLCSGIVVHYGQNTHLGLIPEAMRELLRYVFEDLRFTAVWCGYYDGNEKSKRVQEKCGFIYHHTEYNKPVPLVNDLCTEHFTKISFKDWKNKKDNLKNTKR